MTDAVQIDLLPLITEAEHPQYLLNRKPAGTNACGVFTENVLEFRDGKLTGPYVEVKLCADSDFILYEFSYMTKTYGCGHPLSRPCHECHRSNTAQFLADDIFNVFKNSVLPYDRNVQDKNEVAALVKLCRKVCDRIAREVA
jgi:hypothetical protein